MGSWSDLPENIVENIVKKIDAPTDLLNFSAVCKKWYSNSVLTYKRLPENIPICKFFPKENPLPMLLVPSGNDLNARPYLYSITDKKAYHCFSQSLFHNKWIVGSAGGWLVTVDTKDKTINLLNPLTRKQIALPGFSTFDKPFLKSNHHEAENGWYVEKATLLFDASGKPENSVIVAIVSTQRRICFCRVGDNKWTTLDRSPVQICDIINIRGKLWAVDHVGKLFWIKIGRTRTKLSLIVGRILPVRPGNIYLVESCGKLLMVFRRTVDKGDQVQTGRVRTDRFWVLRMVKSASKYKARYWLEDNSRQKIKGVEYEWVQGGSIGEQMIFLGYNHSISLDSRVYPGCRGNCIYFADHLSDTDMYRFFLGENPKSHDIGVYNLENKKLESLEGLRELSSHQALWLSPSAW